MTPIVVGGGCSFHDAIESANTATSVGGCTNTGTVSKYSPASGTKIDPYPTGDDPQGVAFDGSDTVSKLNPGG